MGTWRQVMLMKDVVLGLEVELGLVSTVFVDVIIVCYFCVFFGLIISKNP